MEKDYLKDFDKTRNPQKVPEGYFDKKKSSLLAIADEQTDGTPKVFNLKATLGWVAGIAAAVLLGIYLYPSSPTNTGNTISEPALTNASIEEYLLEEYPAGVTEENIIINELTEGDLDELGFSALEQNELEDFLDNNFDQTLDYEYL